MSGRARAATARRGPVMQKDPALARESQAGALSVHRLRFIGHLLLDLGLNEQAVEQLERGLALGRDTGDPVLARRD